MLFIFAQSFNKETHEGIHNVDISPCKKYCIEGNLLIFASIGRMKFKAHRSEKTEIEERHLFIYVYDLHKKAFLKTFRCPDFEENIQVRELKVQDRKIIISNDRGDTLYLDFDPQPEDILQNA